jgi:hypothetical protein
MSSEEELQTLNENEGSSNEKQSPSFDDLGSFHGRNVGELSGSPKDDRKLQEDCTLEAKEQEESCLLDGSDATNSMLVAAAAVPFVPYAHDNTSNAIEPLHTAPGQAITMQPLLLQHSGIFAPQAYQEANSNLFGPMMLPSVQIIAFQPNTNLHAIPQQQEREVSTGAAAVLPNGATATFPSNSTLATSPTPALTNRSSVPLYLDFDDGTLNQYQCLLRKQIELFETKEEDIRGAAQGRNTPISIGQVGIRCRHCANLPRSARPKGSVYYSRTLEGVYQVAQNMAKVHFSGNKCAQIPVATKERLLSLQQNNKRASGGKQYWVDGLRVHGVYEDGKGLRFRHLAVGEGGF